MKITYKQGLFTLEITEDELTEVTASDIMGILNFELAKVRYKRLREWLRGDNK